MSKSKRAPQKVPLVEQVVELAMKVAQRHLAESGAPRRRHDFTQRQLMTGLILRA